MGLAPDGHLLTMLPRRPGADAARALARRGYLFVTDTCQRLEADAFRTRLMGRRVICARGYAAAQAFYAPDSFTRRSAMPASAAHGPIDDVAAGDWMVLDLYGTNHDARLWPDPEEFGRNGSAGGRAMRPV